MQEFCPLCMKNGVESRVKAFQLNLEEAVFMCSADKCLWPVGFQDLTFIDRTVGKDWSANWDEAARGHLKRVNEEQDLLLELSAYTPPQTPGNDGSCKGSTVPDKSIHETGITCIEDDYTISSSKTCDLFVNNSINSSAKPKLVVSQKVDFKVQKESTKRYVFIENSDKNKVIKNDNPLVDCKSNVLTHKSTSDFSGKSLDVKDGNNSRGSPPKGSMKNLDFLLKPKKRVFEEFDFDKLKAKKLKVAKSPETKQPIEEKKKHADTNAVFKEQSAAQRNENVVVATDYNSTNVKNSMESDSIDFDELLGITNTSKDPIDDHDMSVTNELDQLLAGISDTFQTNTQEPEDSEDFEWISSLFQQEV